MIPRRIPINLPELQESYVVGYCVQEEMRRASVEAMSNVHVLDFTVRQKRRAYKVMVDRAGTLLDETQSITRRAARDFQTLDVTQEKQ